MTRSVIDEARALYGAGLNVFPQPYGRKAGYPWKGFLYTRLHPTDLRVGLEGLFAMRCNIAVMCGKTSGNLFVIDCETHEAFQHHREQAHQRGLLPWTVQTARGGHLYFRCLDGEVANMESGRLTDAEVRGSRCYVLGAGSLHPSGVIYSWLDRSGEQPPAVTLEQIDWLRHTDGAALRLRLAHGSGNARYNPLSRATQQYLAAGDQTPEGQRNNALFRAACDLAGNGYSEDDAERMLLPIAERSGLPRAEIRQTIQSAYRRPRQPARPRRQSSPAKPEPTDEGWIDAQTFAAGRSWRGRTGSADYAVFMALVDRARTNSNENGIFRASTREISQLARVGINTAQNALKRLQNASDDGPARGTHAALPPLIFYAGRDQTSGASLWRFSDYVLQTGHQQRSKTESLPLCPPWTRSSDSVLTPGDAVERGALGVNGLRVYTALLAVANPRMPSALAEQLRLASHQVSYALGRLRQFGLVRREKAGRIALPCSDLDQSVALPAGTLGRGARRARRYARDRALFVGQIVYRAMCDRRREEPVIEHSCENTHYCDILKQGVRKAAPVNGEAVNLWRCPNCGQVHFAEAPPDMCDYCRDFTTWQPLIESATDDDALIVFALELGATVYRKEDDGTYHLYAALPPHDSDPPRQLPLF